MISHIINRKVNNINPYITQTKFQEMKVASSDSLRRYTYDQKNSGKNTIYNINENSQKASTRVGINELTGREILEIENSNDYNIKIPVKKKIILNNGDQRCVSL